MEFLNSNVDRKLIKEKKDRAKLKAYVFKPGEKPKLIPLLETDEYIKNGWYESPALFPNDKESEEQRQARIDKRREELRIEMETLQNLSQEKLPEEAEEPLDDPVADSVASLPEEASSWDEEQIMEWAITNGYDLEFGENATAEEMLEQLQATIG